MSAQLVIPIELIDAFGAGVYVLTLASQAELWWHRRRRRTHFWLAASALGALVVNLTGAHLRTLAQAPSPLLVALNMLGVTIALVGLYQLAEAVGGKRPGRLAQGLRWALLLPIAVQLATGNPATVPVLMAATALFLLAALWRSILNVLAGDRESRSLAFGLTLLFVTLLYDVLAELQILPRQEGFPVLGFTILYIAAARALSLRYERDYRELINLRGELESRVQQRTLELQEANHRLDLLSRTDTLTGLANRRCFQEAATALLQQQAACLLMIDIDHFKRINDDYGHDAGDAALRAVAHALAAELGNSELLARWGGEEFIALLSPATDGSARAERMRKAISATAIPAGNVTLRLSASFGLVELAANEALDAGITRADAALYHAKRDGRDRVVVAS